MPIPPEIRKQHYGTVWLKVIRPRILERAGHACEFCGKPNHEDVLQVVDRAARALWWFDRVARLWRRNDQQTRVFKPIDAEAYRVKVVLTVAHLDHQPANTADENLRALCQWCHLNHDQGQHHESRARRKDKARPILNTQTEANERTA